MMSAPDATASAGRQYLTFTLAGRECGVDILAVQEIKGYSPITPIPNAPAAMRGVMNLRGAVVPVVDLRAALHLPEEECTRYTVIVVTRVRGKIVGVIVDAVSDV